MMGAARSSCCSGKRDCTGEMQASKPPQRLQTLTIQQGERGRQVSCIPIRHNLQRGAVSDWTRFLRDVLQDAAFGNYFPCLQTEVDLRENCIDKQDKTLNALPSALRLDRNQTAVDAIQ